MFCNNCCRNGSEFFFQLKGSPQTRKEEYWGSKTKRISGWKITLIKRWQLKFLESSVKCRLHCRSSISFQCTIRTIQRPLSNWNWNQDWWFFDAKIALVSRISAVQESARINHFLQCWSFPQSRCDQVYEGSRGNLSWLFGAELKTVWKYSCGAILSKTKR